ncbi:MAG TPA: hydroxyisourate hydrolase [Streptosporangiaceae bacterium]
MSVSVRVFDAMYGRPTIGMAVRLDRDLDGSWVEEKRDHTDDDGRIRHWANVPLARGAYQLEFDLDGYFSSLGVMPSYPVVALRFRVLDPGQSHDISLLITPYAYFTYQQNDMRTLPCIGAMAGMFGTPDISQNGA